MALSLCSYLFTCLQGMWLRSNLLTDIITQVEGGVGGVYSFELCHCCCFASYTLILLLEKRI